MKYDKVYVLWAKDELGEPYICGIFSSYEKAQDFADDYIDGWHTILKNTIDEGYVL